MNTPMADMYAFRALALVSLISIPVLAQAADVSFSIAAQIKEGGLPLIAIAVLSVLSATVAIERLLHLKQAAILPDGLVDKMRPLWAKNEHAAMLALLDKEDSTLARIIAFLVTHRHQDFAVVGSAAGDIASTEMRAHQQKFYALAIVATVAPIVGLLGTVLGMIEAFSAIAYADGMGNPALLAGGISQALINTAAGLCVALPALGMHHYFKHRCANLALALEKTVNPLINQWFLQAPAPAQTLQAVAHAH